MGSALHERDLQEPGLGSGGTAGRSTSRWRPTDPSRALPVS